MHESSDVNLIGDFPPPHVDTEDKQEIPESEPLIPGLQPMQAEPDYNTMDNLTLLSTLNLHDFKIYNDNLFLD